MLRCEYLKLKRSYIFLPAMILPLVGAFVGSGNYYLNLGILKDGWYDLWTQFSLFFAYFFYPTLAGVFSAYLCHLEAKNNLWKVILTTPISICKFYIAKLITVFSLLFLSLGILFVLYFISGHFIMGLPGFFPKESIHWFLGSVIAAFPLSAITLFFALLIKSFTIPIGLSFLGGFSGLIFAAKGYGFWNPFAYTSLAMNSNNLHPLTGMDYGKLSICSLFFVFLFSYFSILLIKRKCV